MPIRFLTDEDFDHRITRGVQRRAPGLDLIRVQDVGLMETDDRVILEWAAAEDRILLTHDVATMRGHAYARVASGLPMAGAFIVSQIAPIGTVIDQLVLIAECSLDGEWHGRVEHLPQ